MSLFAIGDAASGAKLRRARVPIFIPAISAEVVRKAAPAPNIAASIGRAQVELPKLRSIARTFSTRDLGHTLGISYGRGHRWFTLTQVNIHIILQVATPSPCPCVVVEILDVLDTKVMGSGDESAIVSLLDGVGKA